MQLAVWVTGIVGCVWLIARDPLMDRARRWCFGILIALWIRFGIGVVLWLLAKFWGRSFGLADLIEKQNSLPDVALEIVGAIFAPTLQDAFFDLTLFSLIVLGGIEILLRVIFPREALVKRGPARAYLWNSQFRNRACPFVCAENGAVRVAGVDAKRKPGAGVVFADAMTAVAVRQDVQLSRVVGPGFTFLTEAETAQAMIELRPLNLNRRVTVNTRDGIETTLTLSIGVEIRRDVPDWELGQPRFPFAEHAVRLALGVERNLPTMETPAFAYDWCDAIANLAEDGLRQIAGGYTFDQLFALDDPTANPRQDIARRVRELVVDFTPHFGGNLVSLNVTQIELPRDMLTQRVESWSAEWERRRQLVQAQSQAEEAQTREAARALAQREIASSLYAALNIPPGQLTGDALALRLIASVEQMLRDSPAATTQMVDLAALERLLNQARGDA